MKNTSNPARKHASYTASFRKLLLPEAEQSTTQPSSLELKA